MTSRQTLEHELRRVRRPTIPPGLRDRVLRAVPTQSREGAAPLAAVPRVGAWRFLAVAGALMAVLAAGLWQTYPQPDSLPPSAGEGRQRQVVRPAGDDVVVFWLDDDTPVLVELSK
jgi:hypothetical protein